MNIVVNKICVSKEESTAMKGLLIILIVLGHNIMFTQNINGSFHYLYTFHVQCFFILPFLYATKNICFIECFKKNFIRLYYPYILMFIILSIVNYIINRGNNLNALIEEDYLNNSDNFLYYISAIITGNYYLIDYFTGFQFLWFLPVMFSMSVIKNSFINIKNSCLKNLILVLGCVSYILFFVFMYYKPYSTIVNFNIMMFSPFAVLQGVGALFLGYTCVYIMNRKHLKFTQIICIIVFFALSILYVYYSYCKMLPKHLLYTMRFIMPFLFINMLYYLKEKIVNINILKKLGDFSFPIYLIHVPISTLLYMVCSKFLNVNIFIGIISQIIILAVSYSLSLFIYRHPILRKKILPNNIKEMK